MTFLKFLWRKWLPIAQAVGNFQAQVVLTLLYVVVIAPLGIYYRFFSDPLHLKIAKGQRSNFEKWEHQKETLKIARKQY